MAMRGLARAHNRQQKSRPKAAILCNGASDRARTGDPRFTRAVLYQLSYAGGHVMTQPKRQRLSMIRDIANPRKWAPMRVAAPEGVWTRLVSVQRTVDIIHTATPRQWILIMVASPADALALVKGGVPITKISIGHMQAGEGKRSVTPAVAVDGADVAAFKELQKLGIELEICYLPSSNPDPIQLVIGDVPYVSAF